jgi:hypothetical protein
MVIGGGDPASFQASWNMREMMIATPLKRCWQPVGHLSALCLKECLTAAYKALSHANAKRRASIDGNQVLRLAEEEKM